MARVTGPPHAKKIKMPPLRPKSVGGRDNVFLDTGSRYAPIGYFIRPVPARKCRWRARSPQPVDLLFASLSPESLSTWVPVICSSALIATGFGLAIWHKIEDQRRFEYKEWKRIRAAHSDDDIPSLTLLKPSPIRLDTPDPDRLPRDQS